MEAKLDALSEAPEAVIKASTAERESLPQPSASALGLQMNGAFRADEEALRKSRRSDGGGVGYAGAALPLYLYSTPAKPKGECNADAKIFRRTRPRWAIEEIVAKMKTIPPHHTINNTGEGMTEDVVNEARSAMIQYPGSTVHFHPVGETCGFCRVGV